MLSKSDKNCANFYSVPLLLILNVVTILVKFTFKMYFHFSWPIGDPVFYGLIKYPCVLNALNAICVSPDMIFR